jgi:hypothetical protein
MGSFDRNRHVAESEAQQKFDAGVVADEEAAGLRFARLPLIAGRGRFYGGYVKGRRTREERQAAEGRSGQEWAARFMILSIYQICAPHARCKLSHLAGPFAVFVLETA